MLAPFLSRNMPYSSMKRQFAVMGNPGMYVDTHNRIGFTRFDYYPRLIFH
jgi:hypothetical protein